MNPNTQRDFQICISIPLRKNKWLLCSFYDPQKNLIANHLRNIGRSLGSQVGQYEHFILMGNLNVETNNATIITFCQIYGCKNIIKDKTCFKNLDNYRWIELSLLNSVGSVGQNFGESGVSSKVFAFVFLYSLCSFHIHIGVCLKLYTDLNLA